MIKLILQFLLSLSRDWGSCCKVDSTNTWQIWEALDTRHKISRGFMTGKIDIIIDELSCLKFRGQNNNGVGLSVCCREKGFAGSQWTLRAVPPTLKAKSEKKQNNPPGQFRGQQ